VSLAVLRLRQRARLYQQIRAFFDDLGYLEVDTPLLGVSTNTDCHIQSIPAFVNQRKHYLQTSPEFAMKRLLVDASGSIYQVCHAFRDEEQGRLHHPEFSLLEWYSVGFDYFKLMDQVQSLLAKIINIDLNIKRCSYFDLFKTQLDLDITRDSIDPYRQKVDEYITGIDIQNLGKDDCLDLLMSQVIAKTFQDFTFVYDYPASQASLARIKPHDSAKAERFELFYNDIELANGFTELTDVNEQRGRFEQDNARRKQKGLTTYPLDETFLIALEQGLPECAGVAMGLDRLLMILIETDSLDNVLTLKTLDS